MKTYIIAEAGVNHNGDIDTAIKMIDAAKDAGCDCVKFQTYKTELLVTGDAPKADYQKENTNNSGSQFEMLKKLELAFDDFLILKKHCDERGIDFMSTPFDMESADFLDELVSVYKISSGDITNKPLLEHIAKKKKPVIVSTGMSTLEEVKEAVEWIKKQDNNDISLLHCTSDYPTAYEDVNMQSMMTLKNSFPYPYGYSDHTLGYVIPVMAVAMGATIIEKHFTLDKNMDGPDHKASLDVKELEEMVKNIRIVEKAQGTGIKKPTESEISTRNVARKSIVLARNLKKGDVIKENDLTVKRPGIGIEPKYLDSLTGKRIKRDMAKDDLVGFEDFE